MGSLYDRSSNIYKSEWHEITLENSGYYQLPSAEARFVTVYNVVNTVVNVATSLPGEYQPHPLTSPGSPKQTFDGPDIHMITGTAYVTGRGLAVEDGVAFQVNGISNANQVALQKANEALGSIHVTYIVER